MPAGATPGGLGRRRVNEMALTDPGVRPGHRNRRPHTAVNDRRRRRPAATSASPFRSGSLVARATRIRTKTSGSVDDQSLWVSTMTAWISATGRSRIGASVVTNPRSPPWPVFDDQRGVPHDRHRDRPRLAVRRHRRGVPVLVRARPVRWELATRPGVAAQHRPERRAPHRLGAVAGIDDQAHRLGLDGDRHPAGARRARHRRPLPRALVDPHDHRRVDVGVAVLVLVGRPDVRHRRRQLAHDLRERPRHQRLRRHLHHQPAGAVRGRARTSRGGCAPRGTPPPCRSAPTCPVTRYQLVDDPAMSMTPGASTSAPGVNGSSTVGICAALMAFCAATTSAIGPSGRHAHADGAPPPPPGGGRRRLLRLDAAIDHDVPVGVHRRRRVAGQSVRSTVVRIQPAEAVCVAGRHVGAVAAVPSRRTVTARATSAADGRDATSSAAGHVVMPSAPSMSSNRDDGKPPVRCPLDLLAECEPRSGAAVADGLARSVRRGGRCCRCRPSRSRRSLVVGDSSTCSTVAVFRSGSPATTLLATLDELANELDQALVVRSTRAPRSSPLALRGRRASGSESTRLGAARERT